MEYQEGNLALMGAGALISLIAWSPKPLSSSLQILERKAAEGVIAFFEEIIDKLPPPIDWSAFVAALKSTVQPADPYSVLGVQPGVSNSELKSAYRKQLKLNHPDLVASMSDDIKKVAHERTQAINEAYKAIVELRQSQ